LKQEDKETLKYLVVAAMLIVIGATFLVFSWGIIPGLIFLALGLLIGFILGF
jgi:hypothetical protein